MDASADAVLGEDIRFDLSDLYRSLDDPLLERDIQFLALCCADFEKKFRGQLQVKLAEAIDALQSIQQLNDKVSAFLHLQQACDAANQQVQRIVARARESWARACANHLTFFEQEVGKQLEASTYERLLASHELVRHHKPYLDRIRLCARYLLPEPVERALMLREPFAGEEWMSYFDETEVQLSFSIRAPGLRAQAFWGKQLSLAKTIDVMLYHPQPEARFEAMRTLNRGLKRHMAPVAARAINLVAGLKNIEDSERGYPHILAARNLGNMVSDEVVEALHQAVQQEGPLLARRYYRLVATHLGKKTLRWSDRTARPFPDGEEKLSWDQAFDIVQQAYRSFSPFLADVVRRMAERRWIDAPPYRGKTSGAFNYSVDLPEPLGVRSYTFLNFMGSERDVMVLAHELGHAVHGVLAAMEQGPLMFRAPMVYAETASIFGEMLTFNFLLARAETPRRRLALYMEKCSDFVSSVVRQISFSVFEQRVHLARRQGKLTIKDFCGHWTSVAREFYGPEGDVFEYRDMDYLWAYVSHFLNPFYVYSYAFGALLTQSLFAVRDRFGHEFETMYLDLLKAGGTRDAIELLKPFGLNPADPSFWLLGMRETMGRWLGEAERLSSDISGTGPD